MKIARKSKMLKLRKKYKKRKIKWVCPHPGRRYLSKCGLYKIKWIKNGAECDNSTYPVFGIFYRDGGKWHDADDYGDTVGEAKQQIEDMIDYYEAWITNKKLLKHKKKIKKLKR